MNLDLVNDEETLDEINDELENDSVEKTPAVGFGVILREFKKDKLATVSLFFILILFVFIFVCSAIIGNDIVDNVDIFSSYDKPSFKSIADIFGRDVGGTSVLYMLIVGTRNSLIVGVSVTILTNIIGITLGLIMGYYGGRVDNVLMRIIDFIGIMPLFMMIIAMATIIPRFNMWTLIILLSLIYWIGTARLIRSKVLSEARKDYVSASKTMGTPSISIMYREILPNISSIVIVGATLDLASYIGLEVALSFLGFGLPSNTASMGTLLSYAVQPEVILTKGWVWIPAAVTLLLITISINYIGQALKRASDAKQRLG